MFLKTIQIEYGGSCRSFVRGVESKSRFTQIPEEFIIDEVYVVGNAEFVGFNF